MALQHLPPKNDRITQTCPLGAMRSPSNRKTFSVKLLLLIALLLVPAVGLIIFALGHTSAVDEARAQNANQRQRLEIRNPQPAKNSSDRGLGEEPTSRLPAAKTSPVAPFFVALEKSLNKRRLTLGQVCSLDDPVARRILEDYGAMFLASDNVLPPPVCIFTNEADTLKYQSVASSTTAVVGGKMIELQPKAMDALLRAREDARREGVDITPRGTDAARRSYDDTVRLWRSRFLPALVYWTNRGRLSKEQAARLRSLPLHEQVREVLDLEKGGIFFSKDFSKSILYSIAAPGTSQHIMMLALDVTQFQDARVRRILAKHGWFQTVKSDLPHFTYLGVDEKELPALGLRPVTYSSQVFWIPDVNKGP